MVKNGMVFNEKILITSGCSFTGGGKFNDEEYFIKEFPQHEELIKTGVFGKVVLNDSDIEFKKLYKEFLWPEQLGKLLNTKKTYNVSAPGKGLETTIQNIYTCIFNELNLGESSDNLIVIYQVPTHLRYETVVNDYNSFICVTTEMTDDNSNKSEYMLRYYNEHFLYRKYVNELYKLQKFCDALKIKLYMWSWEYGSLDNEYLNLFKDTFNKTDFNYEGDHTFLKNYKSVDNINHLNLKKMIKELTFIDFDGMGFEEYALTKNVINFNFSLKYGEEANDSHPTTDGCKFIAKTLYEKLCTKNSINKYI